MTIQHGFPERLQKIRPPFLDLLGSNFVELDTEANSFTFSFNIGLDLCHSGDIVQGGFSTAMLDATMSHAVFAHDPSVSALSSLEIKVVFMSPARAGKLRCVGKIDRIGGTIAFLSGELYNENNELLCTSTSTAKLFRKK